jgi:hypothetical protein
MIFQRVPIYVPLILLGFLAGHCGESTSPQDGDEEQADVIEIHPIDITETDRIDAPDIFIEPVVDTTDILADITPTGQVGEACTQDPECIVPAGVTPLCLLDYLVIAFPGGYCSGDCGLVEDCGPEGVCVDFSLGKICMKACATNDDCRVDEGYTCDIIPFISDPNTYCIPNVG